MSESMFDLATAAGAVPAGNFTVDNKTYDLFTSDHLSKAQEQGLVRLFTQVGRLAKDMDTAENKGLLDRVAEVAGALRECRADIIATMTSVPKEVAVELGIRSHTILLREIGKQINVDPEGKPETAEVAAEA